MNDFDQHISVLGHDADDVSLTVIGTAVNVENIYLIGVEFVQC